nr:SDR family oxidoreductase [Microbacterium flavescens]
MARRRILVTGATGYIGGRLAPRLVQAGADVRVLVRSPEKLADVPWAADVEVLRGDLTDPATVGPAMEGVDVVYYLAHAMGGRGDFERAEADAAHTVADAAAAAGVKRIVYLGGLHPDGELSKHLQSRKDVGDVLLASGVPTVALQAGVVIGSGSASFEMIRHLTDVLPYMPAPKWVRNRIQPIAVRDVLHYLLGAADVPADVNRTFDIGGPDVLRYGQMMNGYALEAGLKQRPIASLPVFTPWLASQWVNLVTPVPRALAVPIIASLQYDCVVHEHDIDEYVAPPAEGLLRYRTAVRLALQREKDGDVETSWQDSSVSGAPSDLLPSDPDWSGHTVYTDDRETDTTAPPSELWKVVESIGERTAGTRSPWPGRRAGGWTVSSGEGPAPRPTEPDDAARRRRPRLVAGREDRARVAAPPAGGDEGPGRRVARDDRRPRRRRRLALPPARGLLPAGTRRPALLVRDPAVPRSHLLGDAETHHRDRRARCGAACRGTRPARRGRDGRIVTVPRLRGASQRLLTAWAIKAFHREVEHVER